MMDVVQASMVIKVDRPANQGGPEYVETIVEAEVALAIGPVRCTMPDGTTVALDGLARKRAGLLLAEAALRKIA